MTAESEAMGSRLHAARKRRGYGQRELARLADVPQAAISRLEAGTATRTPLAQMERLATSLGVPLTLLISGSPVRERAQVAARTPAGVDVTEAKEYALELLEFDNSLDRVVPDYLLPARHESEALLRSAGAADEGGAGLARQVRVLLELGNAPLMDLPELLEQVTGVDVATAPLGGASGICAIDPERGMRLVVVASSEPLERQRFSLGHELGHLLFDDAEHIDKVDGRRSAKERRCDEFARNLLIPADGVRLWLQRMLASGEEQIDERAIALLAKHFVVSPEVARIQLEELGLLTKGAVSVRSGRFLAQRYGWIAQYEAEQAAAGMPRPPRRVLERAHAAHRQGKLGLAAIARLENRDVRTIARDLEESDASIRPLARRSSLDKLLPTDRDDS